MIKLINFLFLRLEFIKCCHLLPVLCTQGILSYIFIVRLRIDEKTNPTSVNLLSLAQLNAGSERVDTVICTAMSDIYSLLMLPTGCGGKARFKLSPYCVEHLWFLLFLYTKLIYALY